jgi:hypothetical protein
MGGDLAVTLLTLPQYHTNLNGAIVDIDLPLPPPNLQLEITTK